MLKGGHVLGGEQSGHVINRDVSTTGDGLATAMLLLAGAASEMGVTLAEAARVMTRLPQRLVNVRVRDREALDGAGAVWRAVESEEQRLAGNGRILVRPSGTEPLVRVMAEAPTQDECDGCCRPSSTWSSASSANGDGRSSVAPASRGYLRNLDTNGEVSPLLMK